MRRADEALIVIDIQNDFCPGGALAVAGGDEIINRVNGLMDEYAAVVLTQDWHPANHSSFASNHPGKAPFESLTMSYGPQTLWPDHCVQDTHGAEFHKDLHIPNAELIIRKGFREEIDSYSAFFENDRFNLRVVNFGSVAAVAGAAVSVVSEIKLDQGEAAMFNPEVAEEAKGVFRDKLTARFQWVDQQLAGKPYLMGDNFCVADAYLYTVSRWAAVMKIDLSPMTHLVAFQHRMLERPAVREALKAEGLLRHVGLGVNDHEVVLRLLQHADLDAVLLAGRYTLLDTTALPRPKL